MDAGKISPERFGGIMESIRRNFGAEIIDGFRVGQMLRVDGRDVAFLDAYAEGGSYTVTAIALDATLIEGITATAARAALARAEGKSGA